MQREPGRCAGVRCREKAIAPETRSSVSSRNLWYPAEVPAAASPETYSGSFPAEPPAPPTRFTIPGIAVRDAQMVGGTIPAGDRLAWLQQRGRRDELADRESCLEGLCRRGDPARRPADHRPQQVSRAPASPAPRYRVRRRSAATHRSAEDGGVDPSRTALIGYSMGGYGVLTAAGGELDPGSPLAQDGAGRPLVAVCAWRRPSADSVRVASVKAVVAISPAGGSLQAWGQTGFVQSPPRCCSSLATATGPSITRTGARAFFDMAKNSPRYLLTFQGAGTPHRPRAGARRDAATPVGPRLVRGSGLAPGPDRRDQPALHHRLPRPLREGRCQPRLLHRRPDARIRARRMAGFRPATLMARTARARMALLSGRDSSAGTRKAWSCCTSPQPNKAGVPYKGCLGSIHVAIARPQSSP